MGRTYLFECMKCGYRAQVAGGASSGERFSVQTILCHECRELYDAIIRLKVALPRSAVEMGVAQPLAAEPKPLRQSPPPFNTVLNRLPFSVRTRTRWQDFHAACPVAPQHRVRAWQQPDKCTRCGVFLEVNAISFRAWD